MFSIPIPNMKMTQAKNKLGLTKSDYQGGLSTLCGGCGHDSVAAAIIEAAFRSNIHPKLFAKLSGIGCSSKTPAYFISQAHGFNAIHGRMPSVATGANAAHRHLQYLAVSGDGDTGSIGIGQFIHLIRRKINMLYIVENNGIYGLTKGQFSATSDQHSPSKKGQMPFQAPIDLAKLAIEMGAGFVARSFSGDKQQLIPLIQAGLTHPGFALIDVLSPCVSFNNHKNSSKSYQHIRENEITTSIVSDSVVERDEISIQNNQQNSYQVQMHDGAVLSFCKTDNAYDLSSSLQAQTFLAKTQTEKTIATGLLFYNNMASDFHKEENTVNIPLRDLNLQELLPSENQLEEINRQFR